MSKNKKNHKPVKTHVKFEVSFIYDDVMDEWVVAYGQQNKGVIGFANGTTLDELYVSVNELIEDIKVGNTQILDIAYFVDTHTTPEKKQKEAEAFLALKRLT